jgi:hypothetical protein
VHGHAGVARDGRAAPPGLPRLVRQQAAKPRLEAQWGPQCRELLLCARPDNHILGYYKYIYLVRYVVLLTGQVAIGPQKVVFLSAAP